MAAQFIATVISGVAIFFGFACFHMGYRLLRGDRNEYNRNRTRASSFMRVIRGEVPSKYDGTRDDRVAAGIAINLKTKSWAEQGRVSDEALQDVLAP